MASAMSPRNRRGSGDGTEEKKRRFHTPKLKSGVIDDANEIRRIVDAAALEEAHVSIRENPQVSIFASIISARTDARKQFCVEKPADQTKYSSLVVEKPYLLVVTFRNMPSVTFAVEFHGTNERDLLFALPRKAFRVQRRKDERFVIPGGYTVEVHVPNPINRSSTLTYKVFDISSSGLSFIVSPSEARGFAPEAPLTACVLVLRGKEIAFKARVRNHAPLKRTKASDPVSRVKVGVSFEFIDPEGGSIIDDYLLENLIQYF